MYCNNCGNYGHLYRNCKLPIMSYGILSFYNEKDELENKLKNGLENEGTNKYTTKLLMIQRKDSLCYIEFIRGKYTLENVDYIKVLLQNCSQNELVKLKTLTFDELWLDLWTQHECLNERTKKEYSKSKNTFEKLLNNEDKDYNLYSLIYSTNSEFTTPEWEFPKGRRNHQEYNKDCAIREFKEETGIDISDINLIQNISPIIEEYYGTNGVKYRHVYYIAEYNGSKKHHIIDEECFEQYSEIKDIQWFTKEECIEKIRKGNTTKLKIINDIFEFIKNYNEDFIMIK